jgi:hypothetical protein
MKGDIAIAGFMITAEEWQGLDSLARSQLVAVITEDGLRATDYGRRSEVGTSLEPFSKPEVRTP